MDGKLFIFLLFILLPIFYIAVHVAEWFRKSNKYDELQKYIYSGYVKNLEEMLRDKEKEMLSRKIDEKIEAIQNLKHIIKAMLQVRRF